jgi:peptidyl-prolyl cis-trans isomerase A (cyclophilin A)
MVEFKVGDLGNFTVELYDSTPLHRDNFLAYVNAGLYDDSVIHRSDSSAKVVQGGGFSIGTGDYLLDTIPTYDPIINEADLGGSNTYMTLGAARTSDPDSATSQWFINMDDNSSVFDPDTKYDGFAGYTVFGEVVSGQAVVEAIYALDAYNFGGAFTNLPTYDTFTSEMYGNGAMPEATDLVRVGPVQKVAVPEPASLVVLGIGATGLLARRYRRRRT